MRDALEKMAELKFEAPLAQFEEAEDWSAMDFHIGKTGMLQQTTIDNMDMRNTNNNNKESPLTNGTVDNNQDNTVDNGPQTDNVDNATVINQCVHKLINETSEDNFTETFSGSLEDLVNTFDDKITRCFCNYDESVEKLAPVQVRTQEEIMNECQMWWTITGNFGNILPIDWSKSCARKLHMPALNLSEKQDNRSHLDDQELSSEDEAVACDLDMHSLILSGLQADTEPVKTADEVIREIDDIMQEQDTDGECDPDSDVIPGGDRYAKSSQVLHSPLYAEKLRSLSVTQLNELYLELEVLIREFSETLIAELALRDELEYEKELKNSFISLLLAVQNRRRQHHVDKKRNSRGAGGGGVRTNSASESKYLTTVIPYHTDGGPPSSQALQVLIKILKAINEDSPTVPALLTDYILKGINAQESLFVLCPT